MAKIVIGTTNPGKIREVASILSPLGHELNPVSLDVDETGETIEENAKIKALAYSKEYPDVYVICEDSGLVVPGLNNLPGPYSARFHSIVMDDNLNVTEVPKEEFTTDKTEHDKLNNERLIELIKTIPEDKRAAYFEVCFTVAKNNTILFHTSIRVMDILLMNSVVLTVLDMIQYSLVMILSERHMQSLIQQERI